MSTRKLTSDQKNRLQWLKDRNGRGFVDQFGRVVAAGETAPRDSWIAWLNLVAKGYITGKDGILTVVSPSPSDQT